MRNQTRTFRSLFMLIILLALAAAPAAVSADHAWGNYHWAHTSNPFTIKVVNSMTPDWDDNLATAISDWTQSSVMNLTQVAGNDDANTRSRCRPVKGQVR